MSFIARIKNLFEERGVFFKENKRSLILDCPMPECGKEDHTYLSKDGHHRTTCFRCSTSWGNGISFVSAVFRIAYRDAARLVYGVNPGDILGDQLEVELNDKYVISDEEEAPAEKPEPTIRLTPDFLPAEDCERAMTYLAERGIISHDVIRNYDIRYQGGMDGVVFPIRREGELYGWQMRKIPPVNEGQLRLVFSTPFHKANHLLNIDRARREESIILVEGPVDCVHVDLPNYGGVAAFGKLVSLEQLKLINDSDCDRVFIGIDPDGADEVMAIADVLGKDKEVWRIIPPNGKKDFGECSEEEVRAAIDDAMFCGGGPASYLEVYLNQKKIV